MNTPYSKPDVEKIRKAQWTVENTLQTQAVHDRLKRRAIAMNSSFGPTPVADDIVVAMRRFRELDPGVKP